MLANYHTHTWRCNHATGTEREYVEAAIARGIKTLGFADHGPYFFDGDYYSGFRMKREQFADYVHTLRALKAEYADRIDIRIGLEMEYYPKHFHEVMDFIAPYQVDYLIMGQHFLGDDEKWAAYVETQEDEKLIQYVDQVLEGARTGAYTYIAHPDHFKFTGDAQVWYAHMKRLCEGLKEMNIPVEMNLLGFFEGRHYPRKDFFTIAKEVGNTVVLGCDAHSVAQMANVDIAEKAVSWLGEIGITPATAVPLRKPTLCR